MAAATATADATAAGRGERWFEKSVGSPLERFPVLGDIFIAAAERWTDSFSALSASPGELDFKGLRATTVGDLMRGDQGLPIFAALRIPAWDCPIGLALGRPLVATVIEAFFGGGGEEDPNGESRPVSPVEMRIVDVIGGQAATALTGGFKDVLPTRFEFERTQAKPDASFLGKPPTAMIAASFEMRAVGRAVRFDVILPLGALEERQESWMRETAAAPVMDEARWTVQLRAELVRSAMRLRARIDIAPKSLGEIAAWRVGQIIELPPDSQRNVLLTCHDEELFRCELGQSAGHYTVRVDERIAPDRPSPHKGES